MNAKELKRVIILDTLYEINKDNLQYEEEVAECLKENVLIRTPKNIEEVYGLADQLGYNDLMPGENFEFDFLQELYDELEDDIFKLNVF